MDRRIKIKKKEWAPNDNNKEKVTAVDNARRTTEPVGLSIAKGENEQQKNGLFRLSGLEIKTRRNTKKK